MSAPHTDLLGMTLEGMSALRVVRVRRIIDELRALYPDETWTFDWHKRWTSSAGRHVTGTWSSAPQYDGDDETCVISYYMYMPGQAGQRILNHRTHTRRLP